jgi:hypothetical protein
MKKLVLLLGILVLTGLVMGCAGPQIKEFGTISKTTLIMMEEITTHEVVEEWKDGFDIKIGTIVHTPEYLGLGKLYTETIQKKLEEFGFLIIKEDYLGSEPILVLKVKLGYKPATLLTYGAVVLEAELYQKGKMVRYLKRPVNTSPIITPEYWKNRLATWLIEGIKQ